MMNFVVGRATGTREIGKSGYHCPVSRILGEVCRAVQRGYCKAGTCLYFKSILLSTVHGPYVAARRGRAERLVPLLLACVSTRKGWTLAPLVVRYLSSQTPHIGLCNSATGCKFRLRKVMQPSVKATCS